MKNNSFEKKLEELNKIIALMEDDKIDLKKSVDSYKKGLKLIKECESELDKARKELEIISDEHDF